MPVEPRVRSVPAFTESSGWDAVALADSAGLTLDEWQRNAVVDVLAEREDGNWSTFESALILPRQNGKGAVLEAIEMADLFLFGTRLTIHTAHEFKTAREAFERLEAHIRRNDWMLDQVPKNGITTGNGNVRIRMKSGQRIMFLARSGGSGRGFSCDRLIYDEAYHLPDETLAASFSTMSAMPNPQVLYTSSAPLDRPESQALRRIMRRGRRTPDAAGGELQPVDAGLTYIEFSAAGDVDPDDSSAWLAANPAIEAGRMSVEFVAAERATLPEAIFLRERLGVVDESVGATVFDMDVWDSLGDAASSPLDPVVFSVDVAPDQSWSTIAISGARADGLVHVEVVRRDRGVGWVADMLEELHEQWSPASIVLDPIGQSAAVVPALDERNIPYVLFSTRDAVAACAYFYSLVLEKRLRYFPQTGLRAAVEAAKKRKVGESGWAWNRRDSTDITPLVAVTFAAYAHAMKSGVAESTDSRMFFFSR